MQIWNAGELTPDLLDSYQVGVILVEPEAPLVSLLQCEGWGTLYQDSQAVVLGKPEADSEH